jgi:protein-L-isoaspartate(D-aspartate) O-methyltransferase
MERVPRELFVPQSISARAYDDAALPIGEGQTISQPYMVARICEALSLRGHERVLDVGTGSGYQAAVLAELAGEVHTIERIPELAEEARATLDAAGYGDRVHVHVGDGTLGLPEHAPYAGDRGRGRGAGGADHALRAARGARTARRADRRQARPAAPADRPKPRRPAVVRSVPCRFVPLLGEEGFSA